METAPDLSEPTKSKSQAQIILAEIVAEFEAMSLLKVACITKFHAVKSWGNREYVQVRLWAREPHGYLTGYELRYYPGLHLEYFRDFHESRRARENE